MLPTPSFALKPVSDPIYNNGNPIVPLSPSGSLRNIEVLYQALKGCDGHQRLRAGYTWNGRPYVAFVEKKKSHIGKIEAHNVRAQRRELNHILAGMAEAAVHKLTGIHSPDKQMLEKYRDEMRNALPVTDLRVRDVRNFLRRLDERHTSGPARQDKIQKLRERYRFSPAEKHVAYRQRIKQFQAMDLEVRSRLIQALEHADDDSSAIATAALAAVDRLFRKALKKSGTPLAVIAKNSSADGDLQCFAKRWTRFREPIDSSTNFYRMASFKFAAYPWCRLLDEAAANVLKASHRHVHVSGGVRAGLNNLQVLFRRKSDAQPDLDSRRTTAVLPRRLAFTPMSRSDSSLVASTPQKEGISRTQFGSPTSPMAQRLPANSHSEAPTLLPLSPGSSSATTTTANATASGNERASASDRSFSVQISEAVQRRDSQAVGMGMPTTELVKALSNLSLGPGQTHTQNGENGS